MRSILRQTVLLTVAGALSWLVFLYRPPVTPGADLPSSKPVAVAVMPSVAPPETADEPAPVVAPLPVPLPEPEASVAQRTEEVDEPEAAPDATAESDEQLDLPDAEDLAEREPTEPPPPELGAPDAPDEEAERAAEIARSEAEDAEEEPPAIEVPEETGQGPPAKSLMADPELLGEARSELAGEVRQGFATVLLASPEEQIEIARHFGEVLVLVPQRALDPGVEDPRYFRLATDGSGRVESVRARPPLESYRQYRDLFDYEYARLPAPLRELRRSVLSRNEVYLFAALIPVEEWAIVIGRRRAALAATGREMAEVRRFVIRYVRRGADYDVRVEEILFADGTRTRPPQSIEGA